MLSWALDNSYQLAASRTAKHASPITHAHIHTHRNTHRNTHTHNTQFFTGFNPAKVSTHYGSEWLLICHLNVCALLACLSALAACLPVTLSCSLQRVAGPPDARAAATAPLTYAPAPPPPQASYTCSIGRRRRCARLWTWVSD